jgi:hypothetical protein
MPSGGAGLEPTQQMLEFPTNFHFVIGADEGATFNPNECSEGGGA